MRSNRRSWLGRMRPDRGGAAELPIHAQGQICARPPFALERLSVIRGPDGRIARIRYVLPRHKAANWVGPGRVDLRPGLSLIHI